MLTIFNDAERQLDQADGATPALVGAVVTTLDRLLVLRRQGKTGRLDALVANAAWTDAALELLALGAPDWTLARLCRMDGMWLCTLTRHPDVPDWLDDSIEHLHQSLHLALLGAVLEALRSKNTARPAARPAFNAGAILDGDNYR